MATLSLADVSDALSQVFQPNITNQINTTAIGLNLIPTVNGAGKNAAWTAKLSGRSNADGYTEGADMADGDFDAEKRVDAVLPWAQYRKGAKLSGLAQAAAASNSAPGSLMAEGISDLFGDELGDAVDRMALGTGVDLYGGTGGAADPLIGLATAIDSTGVYATIDQGVDAEWASTEQSIATAALSFSTLRAFNRAIYAASGKKPDLFLTDEVTFDLIGDLWGDARRHMQEVTLSDGKGGRRTIALEGGYDVLNFDGIPIARDVNCTANTVYALNTRYIHIKQLPAYKTPMSPERFVAIMKEITGERLPDSALGEFQAAPGSLTPYVEMLGQLGDSERAMVKCYLQLCVSRRNTHGKLTLT